MEFFILFYEKHAILVITSKWCFFILFYEKMPFQHIFFTFYGKKAEVAFFLSYYFMKNAILVFFFMNNTSTNAEMMFSISFYEKSIKPAFFIKKNA